MVEFKVISYEAITVGEEFRSDDFTIKPENVRFDARAERTAVWPERPAFRAKVVALFAYADLDPRADTKLMVFPSGGGEVSFDLNFADIE